MMNTRLYNAVLRALDSGMSKEEILALNQRGSAT